MNDLPCSTPESLGIPSAAILGFIDAVEAAGLEVHGLIVLRRGAVAARGWWHPYGPDRVHALHSVSKSFTSIAVGLAIGEGLLTVDDPVLGFFPGYAPASAGGWDRLRVRHLLTLTTGHGADTTGAMVRHGSGDWVQAFFEQPLVHEPGVHFQYNSGASYMLSAIVQRLAGQRLLHYLRPRLLSPLGIEDATWEQCPRGVDTGGWGLSLTTGDIARFGQMLLQRGRWEGRQLISARWIDEATARQTDTHQDSPDWQQGYGYQFWRGTHASYRADGAFGQFCIVMPDKDAVVAINSGMRDTRTLMALVWEHLYAAMGDPLPEDPSAARALEERLGSLVYPAPAASRDSAAEQALEGRTLVFEDNEFGYKTMTFHFGNDWCGITADIAGERGVMSCGSGRWLTSRSPVYFPRTLRLPFTAVMPAAAAFRWTDGHTLAVRYRLVESPFTMEMAFTFDDEKAVMTLSRLMAGEFETCLTAEGQLSTAG